MIKNILFRIIFLTLKSSLNRMVALSQKTVIGFSSPSIRKRTSADLALFLCPESIYFLWQCGWKRLRARRFFRSGTANSIRAVALSFSSVGDSPLNLRKETVMSKTTLTARQMALVELLADAYYEALQESNTLENQTEEVA